MKLRTIFNIFSSPIAAALLSASILPEAHATPPQYQIYDIGVVQVGDTASQGFGVSRAGVAVGRPFQDNGTQAFTWTLKGGIVGLPNLPGRSYCVSNSANDNGIVVGTGATTSFGAGRLPVIWQNGAVSQLPLPAGETLGDANSVNASNVAAGSIAVAARRSSRRRQQTEVSFSQHSALMTQVGLWVRASTPVMPPETWGSSTILVRTWP